MKPRRVVGLNKVLSFLTIVCIIPLPSYIYYYYSLKHPALPCLLPEYTHVLPAAPDESARWNTSARASRRKYLVDCNVEGWDRFVLRDHYFFLSTLIHDYQWKELPKHSIKKPELLLDDPPEALLFCFHGLENYPRYPLEDLRAQGTIVIHYTDDLQDYSMYSKEHLMREFLRNTDLLLNPYAYQLQQYLAPLTTEYVEGGGVELPKRLWLPHSASREFTSQHFNKAPRHQILLSGATAKRAYPLRHWFASTFSWSTYVHVLEHPGYFNLDAEHTLKYAKTLNSYQAAFTCTSSYRYVVAKIFEIPATGALLLVNLDLANVLQMLGFLNMIHYVGYRDEDPLPMINWVLNPVHTTQIEQIRKRGQQLVKEHHTPAHRAAAFNEYMTKRKVAYPLPPYAKNKCPCPSSGFSRYEDCVANYYTTGYIQPGALKNVDG